MFKPKPRIFSRDFDPNSYANLTEILKFLKDNSGVEIDIENLSFQLEITYVYGCDFRVIKGSGIRWFLQNYPETFSYFFPTNPYLI